MQKSVFGWCLSATISLLVQLNAGDRYIADIFSPDSGKVDSYLSGHHKITFSAGETTASSLGAIRFEGDQTFMIPIPADTELEIAVVLSDRLGKTAYINPFYIDATEDPLVNVSFSPGIGFSPTQKYLSDMANFEVEIRDTALGHRVVLLTLPPQPDPHTLALGIINVRFSIHIMTSRMGDKSESLVSKTRSLNREEN